MSTRTRQDWILWAQLGCALVATAHAEYTLALATGLHWVVAGAVPGALDLYVIRALQKRQDVLPAVLVMVAANVASILVQTGVLPLHWGLYSAVGALAPLLVWRGHVLRVHASAGAVSAPVVLDTAPGTALVQVSESGVTSAPVPGTALVTPDGTPVTWDVPEGCTHYGFCRDANGVQCIPCPETAPDHVPAEWVQPGTPDSYPPLAPVPDLPPEYAAGAVHSAVLEDSDWAFLDRADRYVRDCKDAKRKPSVRGIRRALSIGQDRAERLLEHLGVEP